jgi:hypothetical protein
LHPQLFELPHSVVVIRIQKVDFAADAARPALAEPGHQFHSDQFVTVSVGADITVSVRAEIGILVFVGI